MNRTEWKKALLDGAGTYFAYERKKAAINLDNYLDNSVGIGEHGDVVEECVKLIEAIEHAHGCIEIVDEIKQKE